MPRKQQKTVSAEWSFLVDADKIGSTPMKVSIKPNPEERKLLAQRLNIVTLKSLSANIVFTREAGKMIIYAKGSLEAQVKQECVVSGQPCEEDISETFEAWFADQGKTIPLAKARHDKQLKKGNIEAPILDEAEAPEPIVDGHIDAGELVTQYLSLAINPYPHAEGAEYEHGDDTVKPPTGARPNNPFAALKDWKAKRDKD